MKKKVKFKLRFAPFSQSLPFAPQDSAFPHESIWLWSPPGNGRIGLLDSRGNPKLTFCVKALLAQFVSPVPVTSNPIRERERVEFTFRRNYLMLTNLSDFRLNDKWWWIFSRSKRFLAFPASKLTWLKKPLMRAMTLGSVSLSGWSPVVRRRMPPNKRGYRPSLVVGLVK